MEAVRLRMRVYGTLVTKYASWRNLWE